MKETDFISRRFLMKMVLVVLVFVLGSTIAVAQTAQSTFTVITPGTPFFAVSSGWYQVTVPAGRLRVYTVGDSDTMLEIWDSSARLIAENDDDESGYDVNAGVDISVPAGTYYIRITYYGGYGSSTNTPYVLRVER